MSQYQRIYKSEDAASITYNGNTLAITEFSFDCCDYYGDSADSYIQVYVKAGNYSGVGKIFIDYNVFSEFVEGIEQMAQLLCKQVRIISTYEISDCLFFTMNQLGQITVSGNISDNDCELSFEMKADQTVLKGFFEQLNDWMIHIQKKKK